MISLVIFDLDETLADTGSLPPGRRVPSQLLSPGLGGRDWVANQSLSDLPGELICRGYEVVVATRSPKPYASTLIHLLGIDTRDLWASCGDGLAKATRIRHELDRLKTAPIECLYVGDGEHDRQIADAVGCQYIHVEHARSGALLTSLPPLDTLPQSRRPPRWVGGDFADVQRIVEPLDMYAYRRQDSLRLDREERGALSFLLLGLAPQMRSRREQQMSLFADLTPEHAACIVRRTPFLHVNSRIVTKTELRRDAELRRAYLAGLRRCFPGVSYQMEVGATTVSIRSVVDFQSVWGRALGVVKNYGNHDQNGVFRSGPETELGALDFIADVVAAQLCNQTDVMIIPVPCHPYSDWQPGEVSRRLSHLVAHRLQVPIAEVLQRRGTEYVSNPFVPWGAYPDWDEFDEVHRVVRHVGGGSRAILVEDQITTGTSIHRAVATLAELNDYRLQHPEVLSYSVSRRVLSRLNTAMPPVADRCGFRVMSGRFGVSCPCGRDA